MYERTAEENTLDELYIQTVSHKLEGGEHGSNDSDDVHYRIGGPASFHLLSSRPTNPPAFLPFYSALFRACFRCSAFFCLGRDSKSTTHSETQHLTLARLFCEKRLMFSYVLLGLGWVSCDKVLSVIYGTYCYSYTNVRFIVRRDTLSTI